MNIHLYALCWNDEKMLPYFLRHYSTFVDKIFIYDDGSTDSSISIIEGCEKAELIFLNIPQNIPFRIPAANDIKRYEYTKSRGKADFVVIVDIDEFLYHPNIRQILKKYLENNITFPKIDGYQMVADKFPHTDKQIYSEVSLGVPEPLYSKRCIFDPSIDINYLDGCHACDPQGSIIENDTAELKLLHYSYLGVDYIYDKYQTAKPRVTLDITEKNRGYQYTWSRSYIKKFIADLKSKGVDIHTMRQPKKMILKKKIEVTIPALHKMALDRILQLARKIHRQLKLSLLRARLKAGGLLETGHIKLKIGWNGVKSAGWVTIDTNPNANLIIDIRKGLPFDNDSIDFIYCGHKFEFFTPIEMKRILKEFKRCLKKEGVIRVAISDLEYIVSKYNTDWGNQERLTNPVYGCSAIKTKGEMLNASFRWWGNKYLYNEEDLRNLLVESEFLDVGRCAQDKSNHPELCDLETREDATLIMEANKKVLI